MARAEEHVVADPDDFRQERNHVRCFSDGLAVRDLRLAFVEVLHRKPEQVRARREGEAGARGVVAEVGDREPAVEATRGYIVVAQLFELLGNEYDQFQFSD